MSFLEVLFKLSKPNPVEDVFHTNEVPLGLNCGSIVTMPVVDIALAQAAGSIIPSLPTTMIVTSVGTYSIFDTFVYNVYLDNGTSYLQLIMDKDDVTVTDARLWTNREEILPQSTEEWEFWLGKYVGYELSESGLIGWPEFRIDAEDATYSRSWFTGIQKPVAPVKFSECIFNKAGHISIVDREGMEYCRNLTLGPDNVTEYVLANDCETNGSDISINVDIGIPINWVGLQVLSV